MPPWWPKLELKILPYLSCSIESEIMDEFWCSRCLNNCIDLTYMIGSFSSGTNASLVTQNEAKQIIPLLWIKSSPVDRFWYLSCLNDHIDLPDMIGSFASGAIAFIVAKNQTKTLSQLFKELQGYLEAKFDYRYFIIFLHNGSKIPHKKFQVILSKHEGVTLIFPIQNEIKIWENCRHAFIFWRNDLRFFVWNLRTITQKKL